MKPLLFSVAFIVNYDLRIIEDDILMESGENKKKHGKAYDLTDQTQYYDSFSYRSELRVLKDMAFIDMITLDKERITLQLGELYKICNRFKEFWSNFDSRENDPIKYIKSKAAICDRSDYFLKNAPYSDFFDYCFLSALPDAYVKFEYINHEY